MSHVSAVDDCVITDLEALKRTIAEQCPELEIVKQKTYRTWIDDHGRLVGDWPVPEGMKKEDIGKNAELVIRFKDQHVPRGKRTGVEAPYEIGVVPLPGRPGHYGLFVDFYNQGNGILDSPGVGRAQQLKYGEVKMMGELKRGYGENALERRLRRTGKKFVKEKKKDRTVYRIEA